MDRTNIKKCPNENCGSEDVTKTRRSLSNDSDYTNKEKQDVIYECNQCGRSFIIETKDAKAD